LASYITIINYPKDEIRFIPQSRSPIPTNDFSTGLQLHLNDGGKISVRGVWTGSPADKAGVASGDEIVALNGKTLSGSNLVDLLHRLHDDGIREIEIEIKTAEGQRVLQLKKEKLLPER
jgi:C-terminal processing protease CtpA/Prc